MAFGPPDGVEIIIDAPRQYLSLMMQPPEDADMAFSWTIGMDELLSHAASILWGDYCVRRGWVAGSEDYQELASAIPYRAVLHGGPQDGKPLNLDQTMRAFLAPYPMFKDWEKRSFHVKVWARFERER